MMVWQHGHIDRAGMATQPHGAHGPQVRPLVARRNFVSTENLYLPFGGSIIGIPEKTEIEGVPPP